MRLSDVLQKIKQILRPESRRPSQSMSSIIDTSLTDLPLEVLSTAKVTNAPATTSWQGRVSDDGDAAQLESTWSTSPEGCEVSVTARVAQKELKFNAPFTTEFPLGSLGRFRIKERLGNGLHGRVFQAFDPDLDREVAIKVISPSQQATHAVLIAEARRTSTFHPNLVQIHEVHCVEVGEGDEVHFLVLDLIKGSTLNARMAQPIPLAQAVEWIKQIASGLSAMHHRGIPHLDVQPKNIMIRQLDNQAVVIDIGLERETLSDGGIRAVGGTLAYASPEQCLGNQVDQRSDLFSLGILAYRLFSSHMPFRGSRERLIWEILNEPPIPIRQHNRQVSTTLACIVAKCLQKPPQLRYQSADALLEDLRCFQQRLPTTARKVSVVDQAGLYLLRNPISSLIVCFLVTLTTLSALSARRSQRESQRTATALHDTRLLLGKNIRAAVDFRGRAAGLEHQLLLDAEPYYRKVLQDADGSLNQLAEVAEAHFKLAFLLWGCGQALESQKFLSVAEDQHAILSGRSNLTEAELRLLSVFFMDRVYLHQQLGHPLSPVGQLSSYRQSIHFAQRLNMRFPNSLLNIQQLAHAHINLAAALQMQGDFQSAREARQQGIELLRSFSSEDDLLKSQLAEVLQNQSALLSLLGLPTEAKSCQSEARALWTALGRINQYAIVRFDRLLADGLELVGHDAIEAADQTLRQALEVCQMMLTQPDQSLSTCRQWIDRTLMVCNELTLLESQHVDAGLNYSQTLTAVDQLHARLESLLRTETLDADSLFNMKFQLAQAKGIRVTIGRAHNLPILSDLESITLHWDALYGGSQNRVLLAREYALDNQVSRALTMLDSFHPSDADSAVLTFDVACVYSLCAASLAAHSFGEERNPTAASSLALRALDLLRSEPVLKLIGQVDFDAQLAGDLQWIAQNYASDIQQIIMLSGGPN